MLPGSVALNGDTYQLQQKLASSNNVLYTVLKGKDGKLYSDAPSTQDATYHRLDIQPGDLIGARSNLQAALTYLRESQGDYASYGVVFPDIFKANDDQFNQFVRDLPGFSTVSGMLPALSGGESVSDLIAAQTYLVKLFAGRLNVAHVLNAWAVGDLPSKIGDAWYASGTMFQDDSAVLSGVTTAKEVCQRLENVALVVQQKAEKLGWNKAAPYMDYLAIDKYERDEASGIVNESAHNAYNRNAWINYAYYAKTLAQKLSADSGISSQAIDADGSDSSQILYFQIPSSSLPADLPDGGTLPFLQGLSSSQESSRADTQQAINADAALSGKDDPHLSFALDSFFGNSDLSSPEAFNAKYPQLSELSLQVMKANETGPVRVRLVDHLFSVNANALEDQAGSASERDLTVGLLDPKSSSEPINRDIFGELFGIVWGGGNTSTPFSYQHYQWLPEETWSAAADVKTSYVPNQYQLAPLTNTVNQLVDWSQVEPGQSLDGFQSPTRSLSHVVLKTDETGIVDFGIASEAGNPSDLVVYRLAASDSAEAVEGRSLNGFDSMSQTDEFFSDILLNHDTVLLDIESSLAGESLGEVKSSVQLEPSAYYGFLLISDGDSFAATGDSKAGLWSRGRDVVQGSSSVARVNPELFSRSFMNGEALSGDAVVIGFDDHHAGIEPDWDFDDVLIRLISGGEWIL